MPTLLKTTKWVQAFKSGNHTSSNGQAGTYTQADLEELTDAVNASLSDGTHRIPAVLGHPEHDDPAYGWVEQAKLIGKDLFVKFKDVVSDLADAVNSKQYQSISVRLYPREHPNNPTPGKLNLGHVGFFGACQPAIKGMKAVELKEIPTDLISYDFSAKELDFGGTYFSYSVFGDIAMMFANFREYLIEKSGMEVADKVTPRYLIDSITMTAGADGFFIPEEDDEEDEGEPYSEAQMNLQEMEQALKKIGYAVVKESPSTDSLKKKLIENIASFQELESATDLQIAEALGIADFGILKQKSQDHKDLTEAAKLLGIEESELKKLVTKEPSKDDSAKFATKRDLSDLVSEIATVQTKLDSFIKAKV
jgi:hypothetical protein